MRNTVSRTVHAAVEVSRAGSRILNTRAVAKQIAWRHGIGCEGTWLVEQALTMVGARAGVAMKIGADAADPTVLSQNEIPPLPPQVFRDDNENRLIPGTRHRHMMPVICPRSPHLPP